jgi:hypothetical protein
LPVTLLLDDQVFFVIPAKAGIHVVSATDWIALKLHFVPGSPLHYARSDDNMEHFALKNLIIE